MSRELRSSAALLITLLASTSALARPAAVVKGSEVSFVSRITGSSFVTHSEDLTGTVDYDVAARQLRHADLLVKAESLTSGMEVRDEHMRKYLDTAKFPEIRFTAERGAVDARPGATGTVEGVFTIKGTQRPAKVEVTVDGVDQGRIAVSAHFKLNVTDYGIPRPTFAVVKMDPVIDVTVKMIVPAST